MAATFKSRIADSFGRRAHEYDSYARVQREVAAALAAILPLTGENADILEIGCGTGLLTTHLIQHYPQARLHITDIAPQMLAQVQTKFPADERIRYDVMDGEHPVLPAQAQYDLIVSSMCVQWFSDPLAGLERLTQYLKPNGALYYATIGGDTFQEWKDAAQALDLRHGFLDTPEWRGLVQEERKVLTYDSALDFLREVKGIGAQQPVAGYTPLGAAALRKLSQKMAERHNNTVTWHIVYGALKS